MTKWHVRKYVWSDYKGGVGYGKRTEVEEFIEAYNVLLVNGALHFVSAYEARTDEPATIAARVKGEWFAVDKVEDRQEASTETTTCLEHTTEGWVVSHSEKLERTVQLEEAVLA